MPAQRLTGTIVEWDDARGYGFAQADDRKVFVHAQAFTLRERRPEVGYEITFLLGTDAQGRIRAERAVQLYPNARIHLGHILVWVALLIAPLLALRQLVRTNDARIIFGAAGSVSVVTYALYAADKRRARRGEWRIAESILHWFEALGGWPGAFLAQRRLRHKISKVSYQTVFWLIVVAHQFAAIDYLQDWRMCKSISAAFDRLQHTSPSP